MKLNREQIIKALECCTCPECAECGDCPYDGDELLRPCHHNMMLDALALIRELTEENERLKSVEFTCGFIKPHKVLECPIFDEIIRTKSDTVREIQTRFAMHFGTYTYQDIVKVRDVFRVLDQIAEEMLKGENDARHRHSIHRFRRG